MTDTFAKERHRKAFTYTSIICAVLLLLFIIISWKVSPPSPPVVQDIMEINLGNNDEGFGETQPLIKGDRSPEKETTPAPQPSKAKEIEDEEKVKPDDNAEENAAPVIKAEKKTPKVKAPVTPAPVITPTPKPQKPKIVYDGPKGKTNGNNPTQDNGYTMQGNNKNGKGDVGSPKGNPDSYGQTPGGKIGGPKVISGNRKVVNYYTFAGDLPKATINALVKVSPGGIGTFSGFGKGSTATGSAYATAIAGYLKKMVFTKGDDDEVVTVQFNFTVQN